MFAFRAIVAADGQHPVPSSREHASASASSTRRSLPDVGEFAHTQFIIAMLIALAVRCGNLRADSRVSDSGSEMGAEGRWQVRSGAANVANRDSLTCADVHKQTEHRPVSLPDTEEVTGSIPVPPTRSLQTSEHTEQPETSRGATTGATNSIWPASRRWPWPGKVLTGLRVLPALSERAPPAYAGPSRECPPICQLPGVPARRSR